MAPRAPSDPTIKSVTVPVPVPSMANGAMVPCARTRPVTRASTHGSSDRPTAAKIAYSDAPLPTASIRNGPAPAGHSRTAAFTGTRSTAQVTPPSTTATPSAGTLTRASAAPLPVKL
ncbi:MAG TPA: hypothetical protein VGO62_05520, partial [Myxococcota bacterium]